MSKDHTRGIKKHQWKKGQSGNPKGRPQGTRNHKAVLSDLLTAAINDKDLNDQPITIDVATALGLSLIKKGLATGDYKTIEYIMQVVEGDGDKNAELNDMQKMIVQRAMERALPDFQKMKDVSK